MTSVSMQEFHMPSASLGELNPLPDILQEADHHAYIPIDKTTVTKEESKHMGWGHVNGILPYLIQDGYDSAKKDKAWKAAVLENEYIKATFLPEIGGRLWSLIDKTTGRELLHKNPVFQPRNLALRNAWVSGGVEWNVGIIGHTPFTCDHMFAETLTLKDGTPVLRMYQYERVRRLVFRIEAMLPEESHHLYVRVRIDNTSKEDTAVYWWCNIAADERDDVRVVLPAEKAFRWGYGGTLAKIDTPHVTVDVSNLNGREHETGQQEWDISYTTQIPQAVDFFFDLPKKQRRWISALGGDGYGLIQTSTDNLKGRKLFVWGMGAGGRNWQTFLSQEGSAYLEIQAGLANTQLEHLPMKGGESISWMEAYGPIHAEAEIVHGDSWKAAYQAVDIALEQVCPRTKVEEMHAVAKEELDNSTGIPVHQGENWAAVQKAVLGKEFSAAGLSFPIEVGEAEQPWLDFANTRKLACPTPFTSPTAYQIGEEWEKLLKETIVEGGSRHWYGYFQYGVILARKGDIVAAEEAFKQSLTKEKNPWAMYSLGVLAQSKKQPEVAADWLKQAVELLPQRNLAVEAMQALQGADQSRDVIEVFNTLSPKLQQLGRIQVLYIEALLNIGEIARVEKMLMSDIELTDVKEGEVVLTDLWFRMMAMKQAKEQGVSYSEEFLGEVRKTLMPPIHLDFRMS